jgi:hypothetical protein
MYNNLDQGIAAFESSNFNEAFELLMPLAQAGNLEAQKMIAYMYGIGKGVKMDISEAVKWYLPSAEQGDVIAQNNLATFLLHQDPEEAIKWLLAAAKQNFPFAQQVLGDIYSGHYNLSGETPEKFWNYYEAVKWYEKAAEQGFLEACHRLGEMYRKSTNKDETQALKWYQKAAEQEYQPSQEFLAQAYLEGLIGLPKDIEKAQYWLKKVRTNK